MAGSKEPFRSMPPGLFLRFFRWFCRKELREYIEGDLMELYQESRVKSGRLRADIKFAFDVVLLLRPEIIKVSMPMNVLSDLQMVRSYFKLGFRNLLKYKGHSLINIGGLSIGMAVAIMIGLWVADELNFNKSFRNYDRLGQLYHEVTFGEDVVDLYDVPVPIGKKLKESFAEFEDVAITSWSKEYRLGYKDIKLKGTGMFVEPAFLSMFSVSVLPKNEAALNDVRAIVLSSSLAETLFGKEEAVGRMIKFDNRDNLEVTGIFQDFPQTSHFADVKFFLPMAYYFTLNESNRKALDNWEDYNFQCFVLLNSQASFRSLETKIRKLLYENASEDSKALKPEGFILPMKRWHLFADFENGVERSNKVQIVWMFGCIGIFVLLLACINFMNLSTARSEIRSREVGVRKVMGSIRRQLIYQFLSESLLIVVISFFLAILIISLSLPVYSELAGRKMNIPWNNAYFILSSGVFILITSLLAGSYPALYLSSFNPVKVLKGTFKAGRFAAVPRKMMVVFQFTISFALIVCTLVVLLQIQYAKDRPVGFDRENIIHVPIRTEGLANADYNSLRHELLRSGGVEDMAKSDFPITGAMAGDASLTWEGKDPALRPLVALNSCTHDFPKTNGFQFVAGRDFSREYSTDTTAVIINEMAAALFAPGANALGKKIKFGYGIEREVIGIIKDQVRWTPFGKQSPHIYYIKYDGTGYLTIRLNTRLGTREALNKVEAVIRKFDAEASFDYEFLDEDYAKLFENEERLGKLASLFAVLTIIISCIGIFGLASFAATQRTKEIGIRKILGASIASIWKMLSGDFVRLVLVAVVVATPLAYYFAHEWLQQYEYRIDVPVWVFVITGLLCLIITLISVSYQSIAVAISNPVKSLRSE